MVYSFGLTFDIHSPVEFNLRGFFDHLLGFFVVVRNGKSQRKGRHYRGYQHRKNYCCIKIRANQLFIYTINSNNKCKFSLSSLRKGKEQRYDNTIQDTVKQASLLKRVQDEK